MGGKLLLGVVLGAGIFLALINVLVVSGQIPVLGHITHVIEFREAFWTFRALDVVGQLALLITSTFGVLVLVRERQ
jgi:multisubunit Na+/H+ antiporter MnhB subunit